MSAASGSILSVQRKVDKRVSEIKAALAKQGQSSHVASSSVSSSSAGFLPPKDSIFPLYFKSNPSLTLGYTDKGLDVVALEKTNYPLRITVLWDQLDLRPDNLGVYYIPVFVRFEDYTLQWVPSTLFGPGGTVQCTNSHENPWFLWQFESPVDGDENAVRIHPVQANMSSLTFTTIKELALGVKSLEAGQPLQVLKSDDPNTVFKFIVG